MNKGLKVSFVLPCAIVLLGSCAKPTSGRLQESTIPLPQADRQTLEFVTQVQKEFGNRVWPGFADREYTIMYYTDQGQFLVNANGEPPLGFVPASVEGRLGAGRHYYSPKYFDALGNELSRTEFEKKTFHEAKGFRKKDCPTCYLEPSVYIDSFEGFVRKGEKWSFEDWVSILIHELFHAFQEYKLPKEDMDYETLAFNAENRLVKDAAYYDLIREENASIHRALFEKDQALRATQACRHVVKLRRARYEYLRRKYDEAAWRGELLAEFLEGTARFVETTFELELGRNSSVLAKEPQYHRFKSDSSAELRKVYRDEMAVRTGSRYVYQTGFALSVLLDRLKPDWKEAVFANKNYLWGELVDFCEARFAESRN